VSTAPPQPSRRVTSASNAGQSAWLGSFDRTDRYNCAAGPETAIAALAERHLSVKHTREFVSSSGRATPVPYAAPEMWVEERLGRLDPRIAAEVRVWVEVLGGAGRARAKHHETLRSYLWSVKAPLEVFSARYDSLREVTRDDVLSELAAFQGSRPAMTGTALRSLFRTLKTKKLIFADPTARLRPGRGPSLPVLGLDPTKRTGLLEKVDRVDHRLIVLLVGVHALTPTRSATSSATTSTRRGPPCGSQGAGAASSRSRPRLLYWLQERRDRWPQTAKPYLFINPQTAYGIKPINPSVITSLFRSLSTTAGALRSDRLLAEAAACGGDPLHLVRFFGLSPRTARRYAAALEPVSPPSTGRSATRR
jgi:hypothetical protein